MYGVDCMYFIFVVGNLSRGTEVENSSMYIHMYALIYKGTYICTYNTYVVVLTWLSFFFAGESGENHL